MSYGAVEYVDCNSGVGKDPHLLEHSGYDTKPPDGGDVTQLPRWLIILLPGLVGPRVFQLAVGLAEVM